MEVSIKIAPFEPNSGELTHITWPKWLARFEHFLAGNKIKTSDDDASLGYLFFFGGQTVVETWETNKHRRIDAKGAATYAEVTAILQTVFSETKNACRDILNFRDLKQIQDETFGTFLRRLRVAASNITFEPTPPQTLAEQHIIIQAIVGCGNIKIKEALLKENKLSVDFMSSIAAAIERTQRERATQPQSAVTEINAAAAWGGKKILGNDQFRPRASSFPTRPTRTPYVNKEEKKFPQGATRQCFGCGRDWHEKGRMACPAINEDCRNCGKRGHFARICMKPKQTQQATIATVQSEENTETMSAAGAATYYNIFSINGSDSRPTTQIQIGDETVDVIVDSGAEVSIFSSETYRRLGTPKLFLSDKKLVAFGAKTPLPVWGYIKIELEKRKKKILTNVYIVDLAVKNLLGFKDATALEIITLQVAAVEETKINPRISHPKLFQGLGRFKGEEIHLKIDKKITPSTILNQRIPFALRPKVEEEVKRLIDLDILEEVKGPSKWVSPLVVVPRKNGKIRLCTDARGPNTAIKRKIVIMPTLEDLIVSFNGCKYFSKIDLNEGYHQLGLDVASRELTTFATHHGLFRYKCLNFGVIAAAELFQETIERILPRMLGVRNMMDDILVGGKSKKEHDEKLKLVLDALLDNGFTVNPEKCVFDVTEISFYGHIFSSEGIGVDPTRVMKINSMKKPETLQELQSWLGMINYCARFVHNLAGLLQPFRGVRKEEFTWTPEMDKAWDIVLEKLNNQKKLGFFDESLRTAIITDAGPVAVAGILVQFDDTKTPLVRGYYSKLLTDVERRYSQLDKEMLGITTTMLHFQLYLLGRKFGVLTDHHPLVSMLSNPYATLPTRIQRMQLKIQEFDFDIGYIKGTENPADYLSRHPVATVDSNSVIEVETYVNAITDVAVPVAWNRELLRTETAKDKVLSKLMNILINEHLPEQSLRRDESLRHFASIWQELTVTADGLILKQNKLVIPSVLHSKAIELAHQGHQGIRRTKELLRGKVWFSKIDEQVDNFVKACSECAVTVGRRDKTPYTFTPIPPGPWKWLTMDFAEIKPGWYYLVVEDMYSKFPWVSKVASTNFEGVRKTLDMIFSLFGLPEKISTDNGPPFNGDQFKTFLKNQDVEHRASIPIWPQCNGQAERYIASLKKIIKIALETGRDVDREVTAYLMMSRNSIHRSTGKTPSSICFSFEPRMPLQLAKLRPEVENRKRKEERGQMEIQRQHMIDAANKGRNWNDVTQLKVGDEVYIPRLNRKKLETFYDSNAFTIIKINGLRLTLERGQQRIERHAAAVKKVVESENSIQRREKKNNFEEEEVEDETTEIREEREQLMQETERERTEPEVTASPAAVPASPVAVTVRKSSRATQGKKPARYEN